MGLLKFIKQTWVDGHNESDPTQDTPITASKLNRIEIGIDDIVNEINNMKNNEFITFDDAMEQAEYRVLGENLVSAPYSGIIRGKLIVVVSDGDTHDGISNTIWQFFYDATGNIFYRYKVDGNAWPLNPKWYQVYSSQYKPTKADLLLGNVDNTSDALKPISNDTQTALDGKVPTTRTINSKPLNANITLVKGDIGLGNVDNTSDLAKPISTLTQTALDGKAPNHTHPYKSDTWVPAWTDITGKPSTFAPVVASGTTYGGIKISNVSGVLKIYT